MKNPKLIPLMLASLLILTACQLFSPGATPAATEAPASTEALQPATAGAIPYPGTESVALPVISNNNAYPPSGVQVSPMAADAYPASGAVQPVPAAAIAYPAPVVTLALTAQAEPVYPDLKDGAEINWSQVQSIIFSGQVDKVGQTHDLKVRITLKDGRNFLTTEPAIDDILKLIQQCGELCKDIKVATE